VSFDSAIAWREARSFHHSRYGADTLRSREQSISVCLPARNCAATIAPILEVLADLRAGALIDEYVVIDGASTDATAAVAAAGGATVWPERELLSDYGPVLGKGDAMWRSLSVLAGDLVCFIDADLEAVSAHYIFGLVGPLIEFDAVAFVKAYYRRPLRVGEHSLEDGGGRVNHLVARPALALLYPELGGVRQPLAGEVAARRTLLERIPFTSGYGVEIAMLLDVLAEVGLDGMAQVDLELHHNAHKPLLELSPMAYAVLRVLAERLERDGRLLDFDPEPLLGGDDAAGGPLTQRPPMLSVR
jgi:glucosyl-3-phosphoglycerate synthase